MMRVAAHCGIMTKASTKLCHRGREFTMRALFVILQAILGLAIIALAWWAAAALLQDPNRLPALDTTLNRARELATSDDYRQHIDASAAVLLWGLLPAVVGGILLGLLAGLSPVFRWLLGSVFVTLAAAPLIALMSMLLLWTGLGPQLTTIAVAVMTVFPVANAVMMSLAARPASAALATVRGLRWGVALGATALAICEMLTARAGVATYVMQAGSQFQTADVAAGIVLVFVPVITVATILQAIEEQVAG
jgi:ABC-type nitrate/sulfonate/bicarbonate transport system permease component